MPSWLSLARPGISELPQYTPGKPVEEVKRELGLSDIIKMASNENPLGPSPLAVEALRRELTNIHQYPEGYAPELRRLLSERFGVTPSMVIVGNGSDNIITLICLAFLEPGEEVVFGYPTFPVYEHAALLAGCRPIRIPLKDEGFDLEAILNAIGRHTKLVFICNPNNPTGTIVCDREFHEFMARVPENVMVVVDEAYAEYVDNPAFPRTIRFVKEGRNLIILRTFSKIYGLAGLRIGYAFAPPEVIALLDRVREPFTVNRLAQAAALAALNDIDHIRKSQQLNWEGKGFLYRMLSALGLAFIPTQANFILFDTGRKGRAVADGLLRQGVIVRPGDAWGLEQHIRVTIGLPEHNERFVKALGEVLDVGSPI